MSDLKPLAPADALPLYLDARRDDAAEWTLKSHKYRLGIFVEWCEENGIANLNDLSGRDLYEFRAWRRSGAHATEEDEEPEELAPTTLKSQLTTLRAFLRFCADVDAVEPDLYERVRLPSISGEADVSDSSLDPDRAGPILDYLARYHYASRRHVEWLMFWETGARLGALRALDLQDLDLDGDRPYANGPAVHFQHRPESGTPLKNDEKSERWNSISEGLAAVLRDYRDGPRVRGRDEHGRRPLLTTNNGRISRSAIRVDCYIATRPCWRGEECPHDRDPEECDAAVYTNSASECPSSRSPHDIRKGVVTDYARKEVARPVVSDELNASEDVLDKHYDRRSEREKAAQRRRHLPDR